MSSQFFTIFIRKLTLRPLFHNKNIPLSSPHFLPYSSASLNSFVELVKSYGAPRRWAMAVAPSAAGTAGIT
jgi:hypothetical protein